MSIHLDCPICDQRLRVSNAAAGRVIQCRACGSAVRVPDPKSLMGTKTATADPPATERVGLQLAQIIPRCSEFAAQRPLATLGIVAGLVAALIGFKFAKAAISDFTSNSNGTLVVQSTGPTDPEPWEGVGLSDQNEHVRVSAKTVCVEQVTVVRPGVGVKRKTQRPYLKIVLEIQNLSPAEKIHYSGWGLNRDTKDHAATMKDNFGTEQKQLQSADVIVGQFDKDSIEPNGSIEDILVFDAPASYANYEKLALPAKAIGGEGILRIKIPHHAEASPD
jgi:hypothetical protein